MTRDDLQQWTFERELLEKKLREVERRARASEADETAPHDKRQGARWVTLWVEKLRTQLKFGELQAVRAAEAAIMVGALADDAVFRVKELARLERLAQNSKQQKRDAAQRSKEKRQQAAKKFRRMVERYFASTPKAKATTLALKLSRQTKFRGVTLHALSQRIREAMKE